MTLVVWAEPRGLVGPVFTWRWDQAGSSVDQGESRHLTVELVWEIFIND